MSKALLLMRAFCVFFACICAVGSLGAERTFYFSLPVEANEAAGILGEVGRVYASEPVSADLVVQLESDPILQVPASVTIPAGLSSAAFTIAVGDDGFYDATFAAVIRAKADGWTDGEARMHILENDSPAIMVKAPEFVYGNSTVEGEIRLLAPRRTASEVRFEYEEGIGVSVPASITVPAGETVARFPITFQSVTYFGKSLYATITDAGIPQWGQTKITTLPDDPVPKTLTFWGIPSLNIFSGTVLEMHAVLGSSFDFPQNTNAVGEFRLIDPAGQLNFAPRTIQFTNGVWAGEVTLEGSGSSLQFEFSAAGLKVASFQPFDLIRGGVLEAPVRKAQWRAQSQMFYVTTAATTNTPARLMAVGPLNPSVIVKSLDLPTEPVAISVSDDAMVAWLALTNRKFLRVDLGAWTAGAPLDAPGPVRDLLVLPGETEKFVAVTGDDSDLSGWQVKLFAGGVQSGPGVGLLTSYPMAGLTRGRDASEVFCGTPTDLFRLEVGDGLTTAAHIELWSVPGSMRFAGGKLYHSLGGVFDPETLNETQHYEVSNVNIAMLPFPSVNRVFQFPGACSFEMDSRILISCDSFDVVSGGLTYDPSALMGWDRGFAIRTERGLTVVESPLIRTGQADLAIRFLGPANATYSVTANMITPVPWEFEVENLGPDIADHVELVGSPGGARATVGTLKAGEKRRVIADASGYNAFVRDDMHVISPLADPNRANNVARALTLVDLRPQGAEWQSIPMVVSAIGSSANREHVYAAYSARPNVESPGIAVVDGATATILRTFNSALNLQQIEVTADEKFLFGLAETNVVRRWNLETEAIDQTITVGNGPILDFAVAADDAVVIVTAARTSLFKGGVELAGVIDNVAERKAVKLVNGSLWLVEGNQIRRVEISESGLSAVEGPFALQNFEARFVADADRFYFDYSAFNTTTHEVIADGRDSIPVAFPELGVLMTQIWQQLKVLKRDGLGLIAEETLPAGAFLKRAARFGDQGIAFAGERAELILYKVAGAPLPVAAADLSVAVNAPALDSGTPRTWEFSVTNNSDATALNAHLAFFPWVGIYKWNIEPNTDELNYNVIALGDIAGHQTKTARVTTWLQQGQFSLRARAYSSSPDISYDNNELVFGAVAAPEPSFLRVSVAAPDRAALGETIAIDYTIENAGPTALADVQLSSYEGVGVIPITRSIFSLAAGEKRTIQKQVKITQAGLLSASGIANAGNHLNADTRNSDAKLVFVASAAAPYESLVLPGPILTGNPARNEAIAVLVAPAAIAGLDPRTFEPHWIVPLEGYFLHALATADGRYVWLTRDGLALRIDIETKQVDLNFPATDFDATIWSIASPPGQPDVLLVSYADYQNTQRKTLAFKNGVALPDTLNALGRFGISAEGRVFLAAWGAAGLQELALNATGLSVVTTFPTGESMAPIAVVGTKVFFSFGRIFDVATGAIDDSMRNGLAVVADGGAGAGRVWRTYSNGGRAYLESYDVAKGAADWRVTTPWDAIYIAAIGNRALVSSYSSRRAGYDLTLPKTCDLAVRGDVPVSVAGPGVDFVANFTVTNQTAWLAGDVTLALDLPERTMLLDNTGRWIETNHYEIVVSNPVTHQLEASDAVWSARLKLPSAGQYEIVAHVSGTTAESNSLDNDAHFQINVDPLPVFLIDEITMLEGTNSANGWTGITAGLTAPAPRDMEISFTVTPIDGDQNDILHAQSSFYFFKGRTDAFAWVFFNDSEPELTERFRMDFSADQITLVRTQTVVTLINDDFPVISAPATNRVIEGNSGVTPLVLNVSRTFAPFESEVEFETVSGTAIANRDFIPASGRLVFAAGELNKTVEVGIIGNTEFEPNKQFTLQLKNPLAATISVATTVIIIRPDDPPPPFALQVVRDASTFVEFPVLPGVRYQMEYKAKLTDAWQTFVGSPVITGSTGRFSLSGSPTRFARVKATLQ